MSINLPNLLGHVVATDLADDRPPCRERDSIIQFAELRGFRPSRLRHDAGLATENANGARLITLRWNDWARLPDESALGLVGLVSEGAVLYVGGGVEPGRSYSLKPFSNRWFETSECSGSYRLADSGPIPYVLRGESFNTDASILGARGLEGDIRVIASATAEQGAALPIVFASAHGNGWVIYDLANEHGAESETTPIISRLIDPVRRVRELGSLIAADLAAGRDFEHPGFYNLMLDDRPINHDHLCTGRLHRWLSHMRRLAPDFRLDCAWIPSQARPTRRYVEILKEFNVGFVWHGFLNHTDHSQIADPSEHLRRGREMVRLISERFGVTIQPMMIFPMDRRNEESVRCLRDGGFEAMAEYAEVHPQHENYLPAYLRYSTPLRHAGSIGFAAMRRHPVQAINRDLMLALGALGLPVIAVAHPFHIGLKRFPWKVKEDTAYFDGVIRFAVQKNLRPRPLMDLFNEIKKWPEPTPFVLGRRGAGESRPDTSR